MSGDSPKEIVIAMDVFGKGANFKVGQDALECVYVHQMRKILTLFYGSARGWVWLFATAAERRLLTAIDLHTDQRAGVPRAWR